MTADVFAFRGQAYYGKPGWEFHPAEVQEDFGTWRPAKNQDGAKIANWLVKQGYRMAYRTVSKGHAARNYTEWWAKVELVGKHGQVMPHELRQRIAATVSISIEIDGEEAVEAAMEKLPDWDTATRDRWDRMTWPCGCAYNPAIACTKEEEVVLCQAHC